MCFISFRYNIVTVTIFMALFGSCMSISDLEQNTAFLPPMNIDRSVSGALSNAFFITGDWPNLEWWKIFNNEELNELINQALQKNPTILSVAQNIEIAKQMSVKSRANLFPSIFFEGEEQWGRISQNGVDRALNPTVSLQNNEITLNLAFTYEFDFWGKYRNLFKSSLRIKSAEIAETKQVELITSASMAQAYYALKSVLQQKKLYNELLEIQLNILNLISLLEQHAILSKIDPATAKENVDETIKIVSSLDQDVAFGMHLVNILKGDSPDTALSVSDELSMVPQSVQIPQDLSSDLLIRRPDLVAAILRVEALAFQTNAAVADFFPRVNLKGYLGLDSLGYEHLMNWKSGILGLIPSVYIPIFNMGAVRANLKMKKAEMEKAIYDYNQILLRSLQEVSDSLSLSENWFHQKQSQKDILANAQLKLDLVELKTQHGINSALDFFYEKEEVLQKKIQDVEITLNQYISLVNLMKALGGGFTQEDLSLGKVEHGRN